MLAKHSLEIGVTCWTYKWILWLNLTIERLHFQPQSKALARRTKSSWKLSCSRVILKWKSAALQMTAPDWIVLPGTWLDSWWMHQIWQLCSYRVRWILLKEKESPFALSRGALHCWVDGGKSQKPTAESGDRATPPFPNNPHSHWGKGKE